MIKKTKLPHMAENKIMSLLNVVPDWAYVTSNNTNISIKWTSPRGVWAVDVDFPINLLGSGHPVIKVSGRGLEMNIKGFDNDDIDGIIMLLRAQGALKVKEEE